MTRLLIILFLSCWALMAPAQRISLSGLVSDAQTGETLPGATVMWLGSVNRGTTANENGLFSLAGLPTEKGVLQVSFIGYQSVKIDFDGKTNKQRFLAVGLFPSAVELKEVSIMGNSHEHLGDRDTEMSRHHLTSKAIQSIPTARNDVFKALRYLPGIEATEPLSPMVSVRGSDPGDNLIMLDGVAIYNPYHFISSTGIFNMQTVKAAEVLAGGFGAEYGGRNASVINISTKDGDQSGVHGEVQPTTVETKAFVEFPVGKKTTMMTAARINYDLLSNLMLYSNNYFYDANFSLTHRFSDKNRLTLKYFTSRDHTKIDFNAIYRYMGNSMGGEFGEIFEDLSLKWQNQWRNNVATAIWQVVASPRLFFRLQVAASLHDADNYTELSMLFEDVAFDSSTKFQSKVHDYSAKFTVDYNLFHGNTLKAGAEFNQYEFFNASALSRIENESATRNANLQAFFIEDKMRIGALILRPGIRFSNYRQQGFKAEPRFNAALELNDGLKILAAWGIYNQYIVSMNTQEFEFNQFLDYYYPLGNVDPSRSVHYMLGAVKQFGKNHSLTIDLYYKDISRTYIFDLLQSQYEAFALSDKIVAGSGKSLGMELLWRGSIGKLSGWGSYALSKSTRSFSNIMNGREFAYDYDRRHSLKAVLNYQATQRISYSASLLAQSGVPRSVERTGQVYYQYEPLTGQMVYNYQFVTGSKNSVRMPWLLYLDFGLQKELISGFGNDIAKFFGADHSYLTLNVYNALFFRRNVLYYFSMGEMGKYVPMGDSYLPLVSAGYTIKF
jgi:outer membrane cobalamin receptor